VPEPGPEGPARLRPVPPSEFSADDRLGIERRAPDRSG
jgi:hypothetical protein